jgi:hypothetical protein
MTAERFSSGGYRLGDPVSAGGYTTYVARVALDDGTGVNVPLPAALGGSGGLKVDIVGGSSAGTEYVEDAAAAANPAGGALILIRRDTLSASEVSADGDNIAAKATSKGQLHVRALDVEALLPAALAANGGLKVEGVAGGVAQPVSGTFWQATQPVSGPQTNAEFLAALRSTAAFTSVNSGTSSVTILASNANRKGAIIVNTDANILYIDLTGGTAATTRYASALATGDEYEVPFGITGTITGIWAADGAGAALVTEAS